MFGSSFGGGQQNATPFGQQQSTTPFSGQPQQSFGTPAPALFGSSSPAPAFGQQQQAAPAPSIFGQPAPAPSSFAGGFAPAPPPTLFGAPAPASGFTQQQNPNAPPFGQAPSTSTGLFGAPAPASGFGQQQQAAPAPSIFGQPAPASSPFGGGFGQPSPAPSGFGTTTSAFGAAPSGGLFGAPSPSPATAFGAPSAPSAFSAPAPAGGLFASPSPAPAFAQQGQAPGAFGAPATASFGSASSSGGGTSAVQYQVTSKQDGTTSITLHSIAAMPQFENKSHEELRFEDYSQGNKGSNTQTSAFGSAAPAPSGNMFGSAPAPASFGSQPGSLFGSNPAPAPSTGIFGGAPSPAPSTGFFGGTPSPAPGGLFSSNQTPAFGSSAPAPSGTLFGSSTAPAPFGQSGGLFGPTPAPAPSTGFGSTGSGFAAQAPSTGFSGGFGTAPTPSAPSLFGSSTASAPFGSAPAPTTSLFGGPAPASNAFGGGGPAPALNTFGGFGQAPASGFGGTSGGLFGSVAQQQQQQPQQQQQQQQSFLPQPLFASNAQIIPPVADEALAQRLRALENQRKELEKTEVWRGGSPSHSTSSTPTNNYDTTTSPFFGSTAGRSSVAMMAYTPRSTAKIRPRGFPKSESSSKSAQFSLTRRDNRGMMSPEASLQSSSLKLVIRPDSLQKSRKFGGLKLDGGESKSPEPFSETIDPQPHSLDGDGTSESTGVFQHTATTATGASQHTPQPRSEAKGRGQNSSPSLYDPPVSKSPGYDYYQQVIGDSTPAASQGRSPTQTPRVAASSLVPTLTKEGYKVTPPLEELAIMGEGDLASVSHFSVSRPGYGQVEWEGAVDVRGADLDRIVIIEKKDVSVYEKDEAEGTKPDQGSKLNRPAKITFYQVFHKKGAGATREEKEAFAAKIEKTTKKIGAQFLSYNAETGVWCIRVDHFSRYGLLDEDTDEENASAAAAADESSKPTAVGFHQLPELTPRQEKPFTKKRKATPFRSNRIALDDQDMSETSEYDYSDFNMVSVTDVDAMEAEAVARAIMDSTRQIESAQPSPYRRPATLEDEEGEDSEEEDIESNVVPPAPEELELAATGMSSICGRLLNKAKVGRSQIDFGRSMGRSFRVGWLPNGSFLKLDDVVPAGGTLIVHRPKLSAEDKPSSVVPLLKAQQARAQTCACEDGCPLFALCGDDRDPSSTVPNKDVAAALQSLAEMDSDNEDAKLAFSFLSNLVGTSASPVTEELTPPGVRQSTAAYELLLNLCSHDTEAAVKSQRDSLVSIFAALSGGDIGMACETAVDAGFEELACALASGTAAQTAMLQLVDAAASSDLPNLTNPATLRVLNNAGGALNFEDKRFREGDGSLDWRQRLVLRLLQDPNKTLDQTLQKYENDIAAGTVPYPKPSYLVGRTSNVESLFYRLLKFCADPSSMSVRTAVNPNGLTPFLSDFGLSFHLLAAIGAAKLDRLSTLSELEVERVLNGFESQLTMQGWWEYAVFVALSQIGPCSTKTQRWKILRAKALVIRHFNEDDRRSYARRDFLERKLGIPSHWLDEALCYRAGSSGDSRKCIYHALGFDEELGRSMFTETILPGYFFDSFGEDRMALLEQVSKDAPPDSVALAMFIFADFEDRIMKLARGYSLPEEDEHAKLKANASMIEDTMKALLAKGDDSSVTLLCPVSDRKVHMSSMAYEVLNRMSELSTHLESIDFDGSLMEE